LGTRQSPPQAATLPEYEENLSLPYRNNSIASSDQSTISQALSKITLENLDDDSSVGDERIEVIARADRLGVVIDTSIGGAPIVHAIKNTSVLMNQVNLRDALVSVDGLDTSKMSAYDASRIILSKGQKQCVFVFSRSQVEDPEQ